MDVVLSLKELGFLVFGAPYEAEYQLVRMERDGVIDAVFTTDGDAPLGGAEITIVEYEALPPVVGEEEDEGDDEEEGG